MATTGALAMLIGKNTGTTINADYVQLTGTKNLCDGNWHYIVCTLRNNYAQIYADGVLEAAGYSVAPAYAATNYVLIGMGSNTGVDAVPFNGQIDDVFFINGYAVDEQYIRSRSVASAAQGQFSFSLTKYAIITSVGVYDGSVTPLTFWGGTDFAGISGTMGTPYISTAKCPTGFNISPDKWRIYREVKLAYTKSAPVNNTWYYSDFGSISLDVPIGSWRLGISAEWYTIYNVAAALIAKIALSTSQSTITHSQLIGRLVGSHTGTAGQYMWTYTKLDTLISFTAKTTFYLILQTTTTVTSITLDGTSLPVTVFAECPYL
jgi:hypothetical protein